MFQGCNLLVCELALCFNNSADRSHIAFGKRVWLGEVPGTAAQSAHEDAIRMKTSCEACERALLLEGEAYICSFECTFCPDCAASARHICPNCGGELLLRPRRKRSPYIVRRIRRIRRIRRGIQRAFDSRVDHLGCELWSMVLHRLGCDTGDLQAVSDDR